MSTCNEFLSPIGLNLVTMLTLDALSIDFKFSKEGLSQFFWGWSRIKRFFSISFLKIPAETLESLDINWPLDQALFKLVSMPRLKSLKIDSIFGEIQEFPENSTITSLEVYQGFTAGDEVRPNGTRSTTNCSCFSLCTFLI